MSTTIGTNIGGGLPSDESQTNYSMDDYQTLLKTGMITPEVYQQIVGSSGGLGLLGTGSALPDYKTGLPNLPGPPTETYDNWSPQAALGNPDGTPTMNEGVQYASSGGMIRGYDGGGTVEPNTIQMPSTQDPQLASGANSIPGAQPVQAGISDYMPGYSQVKDLAGGLADQANQQTFQNTNQVSSGALNPNYSPAYEAAYGQLAPQTQAAQKAAIDAAAVQQQQGVPVAQAGLKSQTAILADQAATQEQIAQAGRDFGRNINLAENSMNAAIQTAQTNPRSDVWNNLMMNHPIMTSIALVLGGIGGGLTGQPNAALGVINNRIQDAIDQRADTLKYQYEQSLQYRGIAQDALTNLDKTVLAKSIAGVTAYNAAQGAFNMVSNKIASQTAVQQATVANSIMQQKLVAAQSPLVEWTKQQMAEGNTDKLNAAGYFLNEATGAFEFRSGKTRSAPNYQNQPTTPAVQQNIPSYGPPPAQSVPNLSQKQPSLLDAIAGKAIR